MADRMPEDVPVRTCINVMVGITRSKVIFMGISWTMGININKHGYVLGVYIYDYICDFLTNMGFVLGEYQWDIRYQ